MSEFRITKKITNGHQHMLFLRDDGTGIASEAMNHVPQIMFNAGIDEATGQQVRPPQWIVVDPDGSLHEVVAVPLEDTPKPDPKKTVEEVLQDFSECYEYEKDSRQSAIEAEQIYSHDPEWLNKIKPEDPMRSFAPVNVVEDKMDTLTGYQRQNRTDIQYLPSESGDSFGADVLNIVTKKILNMCYYQREKSKVFEDEGIVGRGLFNIGEDYEADVQGRIFVEKFQWDEAFLGPHNKEDGSDMEVMFKTKWYTEQGILSEFDGLFTTSIGSDQKDTMKALEPTPEHEGQLTKMQLIDKNAKKYRLLERWKREYKRVKVFVYASDEFVFNPAGWSKEHIKMAESIPGMKTVNRKMSRMKLTKIVSDKFLEESYLTYQRDDGTIVDDNYFEIIPVYGKFRRGRFWGKVEGIKGLQLVIIKVYGQFIDLIAQVRNGMTYYDGDTFENTKQEDEFRAHATTPGHTQKVASLTNVPKRDEGIRFPNEIVNAIQIFSEQAREIFNVNLGMQGMGNAGESGVLLKQKIIQQLIGNDFLFDNMMFAEQVLAKILVRKIQKLYTPERLLRILVHENKMERKRTKSEQTPDGVPLQVGGKPVDEYPEEELLKLLRTVDFADVDVDVAEAPNSPSALMGAFLMCLEAAKTGAPIPPDIFINLYPIPEKLKAQILQSLQAAQQAEAAKDDKKYSTEIEKTKIAHGDTAGAGQGQAMSSDQQMGAAGMM